MIILEVWYLHIQMVASQKVAIRLEGGIICMCIVRVAYGSLVPSIATADRVSLTTNAVSHII